MRISRDHSPRSDLPGSVTFFRLIRIRPALSRKGSKEGKKESKLKAKRPALCNITYVHARVRMRIQG